jgi:hypothetical protein
MMENKKKGILKKTVSVKSADVDTLYQRISGYIYTARQKILTSVNTEMVKAYWLIGRDIVEAEQKGEARGGYGKRISVEISARLRHEYGDGFGVSSVSYMKQFYFFWNWEKALHL